MEWTKFLTKQSSYEEITKLSLNQTEEWRWEDLSQSGSERTKHGSALADKKTDYFITWKINMDNRAVNPAPAGSAWSDIDNVAPRSRNVHQLSFFCPAEMFPHHHHHRHSACGLYSSLAASRDDPSWSSQAETPVSKPIWTLAERKEHRGDMNAKTRELWEISGLTQAWADSWATWQHTRPGNLSRSMDDKRKTQWKPRAALQVWTAAPSTENILEEFPVTTKKVATGVCTHGNGNSNGKRGEFSRSSEMQQYTIPSDVNVKAVFVVKSFICCFLPARDVGELGTFVG